MAKKKSEIKVSSDLQRSELERLALETSEVKAIIKDNEVKKIIVVFQVGLLILFFNKKNILFGFDCFCSLWMLFFTTLPS